MEADPDAHALARRLFARLTADKDKLFLRVAQAGTSQNRGQLESLLREIQVVDEGLEWLGRFGSPQPVSGGSRPSTAVGSPISSASSARPSKDTDYLVMTDQQKREFHSLLDVLIDDEGLTDNKEMRRRVQEQLGLSPNLRQVQGYRMLKLRNKARLTNPTPKASPTPSAAVSVVPPRPASMPSSPAANGVAAIPHIVASPPEEDKQLKKRRRDVVNAIVDRAKEKKPTYEQIRVELEHQGIPSTYNQICSLLSARTRRLGRKGAQNKRR